MTSTFSDVHAIMPETTSESVVTPFILVAEQIVDDYLANEGLSDDALDNITKFLTAHFLHLTFYRQAHTKSVEDASESYARLGEGLNATTYGQIVKAMDTTGILVNIGKTKAHIEAIVSFDDSPLL